MTQSDFYGLVRRAEISNTQYPLQGVYLLLPNGTKILRNIERVLFSSYYSEGYDEVELPTAVPEQFVSHLDTKDLLRVKNTYRQFVLSPSSEVQSLLALSSLAKTSADLPLKFISKSLVFRENDSTSLIKSVEFLSYELHGFFNSHNEADSERMKADSVFDTLTERLGIPTISVTENPTSGPYKKISFFPFSQMYGTIYWSSVLGTKYTSNFKTLTNTKGIESAPIQLNVGITNRMLATYLANHMDDKGFMLDREIAPYDVFIPMLKDVDDKNKIILESLKKEGFTYRYDSSKKRSNAFSKFYALGVPLMICAGKEQLQIAPRTGEPIWIDYKDLSNVMCRILNLRNEKKIQRIKPVDAELLPDKNMTSVFRVHISNEKKFSDTMKRLGYLDSEHAAYVHRKY